MKNLNMAIIGFGTVGQGLAEIIIEKAEVLKETEGIAFNVTAISDFKLGSVADPNGLDLSRALAAVKEGGSLESYDGGTHGWDAMTTISECGADIMLEATYTDLETGEPAIAHVKQALNKGMHVATTNKGPVVLASNELIDMAKAKKLRFLFEGTVMSGTPTLSLAMKNLAGCEIRSIAGILNGTTNYMLTEMEGGLAYADALNQAQELGYAEAVPDADVEGHDAMGKVIILSNLLLGGSLTTADVQCEGITKITPEQIKEAAAQGKRYKLIGRAEKKNGGIEASVQPMALPLSDPLAGVGGATNALTFDTDLLGPVTVVGAGAGRVETGFSLYADMIDIARSI